MFNKTVIINKILTLFNIIMPKNKNWWYVQPLSNCEIDKYDLINYTSDSALTYVNYWMRQDERKVSTVHLIIYHPERVPAYKEYVSKCSHIKFNFICINRKTTKAWKLYEKIVSYYYQLRSSYIIVESVPALRLHNSPRQKQICLEYFISCKSDYLTVDYRYVPHKWFFISSGSLLDTVVKSAAYNLRFETFYNCGLTRNDNLFVTERNCYIRSIIEKQTGYKNPRIIFYAPTYRDYENLDDVAQRNIWGYEQQDNINQLLEEENIVVIAKLHPRQNFDAITSNCKRVFVYHQSFDYSAYEIMRVSDIMITDYSSIGYDWILMNKPIIYNLYDIDKYAQTRGMAFDPYEEFCPGIIAKTENELASAIEKALKDNTISEKYLRIKKLMHKNVDGNSCELVYKKINDSVGL